MSHTTQTASQQIDRARNMGRRAATIGLARVPAFDADLQVMLSSAEVAATMLLRTWLTGYDHVVIERMMADAERR